MVRERGHSLLGVKRETTNWYRTPELHAAFRALQASGFFRDFQRVLFCGPSMGGYAALAFAACAPGCTVLALHAQSTLAPDRVWFDQRFAGARAEAWAGDFVDGVDGAASAARVYACYDPYQIKDRLHVERLPPHNLVRLRMPFVGHRTAQALHSLGLLGVVLDGVLDHALGEQGFREMARARVGLADYHCRLGERGRWTPRRQRHFARALAIDADHPRAALMTRSSSADESPNGTPLASSIRRWPSGIVTCEHAPLVYLNIPKAASTTIQNQLLYIALGMRAEAPDDIHQHPGLTRSREDRDEAHAIIARQLARQTLVFTFVRDPGQRAYAFFTSKIERLGARTFARLREVLRRDWGLRLPGPGQRLCLASQSENFACYLRFVQANLAGGTGLPRNPHWCPQTQMLDHFRKFLRIDAIGKVENFAADMALVLHRAGARRIPDLGTVVPQRDSSVPELKDILTPEIEALLARIYEIDYQRLGYRNPGQPAS